MLRTPVQGEAGASCARSATCEGRQACSDRVLFVVGEIQAGLRRTGATFACEMGGVVPDVYVLGQALGGGILSVSAVARARS